MTLGVFVNFQFDEAMSNTALVQTVQKLPVGVRGYLPPLNFTVMHK